MNNSADDTGGRGRGRGRGGRGTESGENGHDAGRGRGGRGRGGRGRGGRGRGRGGQDDHEGGERDDGGRGGRGGGRGRGRGGRGYYVPAVVDATGFIPSVIMIQQPQYVPPTGERVRRRRQLPAENGGNGQARVAGAVDFTRQWIDAIEHPNTISDVIYHGLLVESLRFQIDQAGPPMVLPPAHPAHNIPVPPSTTEGTTRGANAHRNAFESLFDDEEEDESVRDTNPTGRGGRGRGGRGRGRGRGPPPAPAPNPTLPPIESMQVRYLIRRAMLALGEAHRCKAIEAERQRLPHQGLYPESDGIDAPTGGEKKWHDTAFHWTQAYYILNQAILDLDPWFAALLSAEMNDDGSMTLASMSTLTTGVGGPTGAGVGTASIEGHNTDQLSALFDRLDLVKNHTEGERTAALERMGNYLGRIIGKLTPLRRDRDEIRNRVGDDNWVNNPEPKMDYATRIIALHKEKVALEQAIMTVQTLSMFPPSIM